MDVDEIEKNKQADKNNIDDEDLSKMNDQPQQQHRQNVIAVTKTISKKHIDEALAHARSKIVLLINKNQSCNPMLKYITQVRKEYHSGITQYDFLCTSTTPILYLSLQYHKLHPNYIYQRLEKKIPKILLILTDISDHRECMQQLHKLSLLKGFTIICAYNEREAGRWLETFTSFGYKGTESIQTRIGNDYKSKITNCLAGSIRGINKTDVTTLLFTFGSFKNIALIGKHGLRGCPGMGETKVNRLYQALHQPFCSDVEWNELGDADGDNDNDGGNDDDEVVE